MRLNLAESSVLKILADVDDGCAFPFAPIMSRTKLDRATVRRACRSLARKGLAEYARGLWTMDGEPAGAGYGATIAGREMLKTATEESK